MDLQELGRLAERAKELEPLRQAAERVVKFTKLANASSPEAYKLHVASDSIEISAASSEGFR